MQYLLTLEMASPLLETIRPSLTSHDSSQECSLEHWLEVRKLVNAEDPDFSGYVFDDALLSPTSFMRGELR
jgi:hypothetical protein